MDIHTEVAQAQILPWICSLVTPPDSIKKAPKASQEKLHPIVLEQASAMYTEESATKDRVRQVLYNMGKSHEGRLALREQRVEESVSRWQSVEKDATLQATLEIVLGMIRKKDAIDEDLDISRSTAASLDGDINLQKPLTVVCNQSGEVTSMHLADTDVKGNIIEEEPDEGFADALADLTLEEKATPSLSELD